MPDIMPWHLNQLKNPEFTRVDLVKEGANSQAHIMFYKSKGGDGMDIKELLTKMKPEHAQIVNDALEAVKKAAQDEAAQTIEDLTKAKNDAEEALAAADIAKSGENKEEEILKTIKDPAVRALMETQIAKTKAAEALIAKQAEEKMEIEAIAKAKEATVTGASEEQLVGIYKGLADKPELREEIFGIFKAASALASEGGAFQAIGKGAHQSEGTGTKDAAWEQIEKAAEQFKSEGLGHAQAVTKAIQANPELYKAYLNGQ